MYPQSQPGQILMQSQPVAPVQPSVSEPAAPRASSPLHPLVLTSDGNHWCGTFRLLVTTLMQDLLPEGPVTATITYRSDDDTEQTITGEVRAFEATRDEITVQDGRPFEAYVYLWQILSIAIH